MTQNIISTLDFSDKTHALSLADYLSAVKLAVDEIFADEVWVQAQIRAVNSRGGHTYFELAQTDDSDTVVASCRATLWKFRANVLKKFEQATGTPVKAGLSVLIKGKATFHAQYGFSFNISDLDPNYTLGALAAAYNAMKNKLAENGLLTLNGSLPLPFDLRHIIVIAPQNAAGLGDFRAEADILQTAGACEFYYHFATFQGNTAPSEIRVALGAALAEFTNNFNHLPDLVVVIRGGGAVGDLAYLNDYELAAMLAETPVPVWVGIGHERDRVILDEVAHTRFDTPSKVVAGIKDFLANRWGTARQFFDKTQTIATAKLNCAQYENTALFTRLHKASQFRLAKERLDIDNTLTNIQKDSLTQLNNAKTAIRHYQTLMMIYNPKTILNQGYAIIKKNDKLITSINEVNEGDELMIVMKDGNIQVMTK